jgi:hypothetical protein
LKTGYGVYLYPEGEVYKGQWSNNLKTGYGVMTYYGGSYYKGNWKDGSKNGNGTYKNSKGIEFSGNWVDDKLNGKGLSELDKLDKPMTPPSSNPQTPVGSNPQTPVSSKPSDAPDTKTFQQWVINKKGDKTILGKGGDSGFGDDGQWGARTKAAWDKYKNDYELETKAAFQGINPNEDGSGENFEPPVATNM